MQTWKAMNKMRLSNPATIVLPSNSEEVQRFLTFTDRSVQYQMKKLRDNYRWRNSDSEGFTRRMEELKSQLKRTLIFNDTETGEPCTYSGLWKDLNDRFGWELKSANYDYSKARILPWATVPPKMRDYQQEAVEALIKAQHGAIALPTGSGKSLVLINITKEIPVQTVVATPSKTITNQLYDDYVKYFGKKFVGKYGSGKKDLGKLFTIATAQALTRIEPETEEYEFFSKTKMLMFDESHTCPAETFEKVCLGVLKDAPLRFFVSATQVRGDGSELLLRGITGPIVYSKDFKELVELGWLARPYFKIFNVPTNGFAGNPNIDTETRNQLYLNPNVNKLAAEFAFKAVTLAGRQTVILIEEFRQFMALKNYITIPFEFVHGGAADREDANGNSLRDYLPKEYWKCDVEASVARFNSGECKLLIGTSAISTGVDLRPVGCLIYLQGGKSEVKVKQAIGRGTRVTDTKKDVIIVDFRVEGSPSMERHLDERIGIYETLGEVQEIKV